MAKLILCLLMQYYAILFVKSIISSYCSPNNAKGYILLCKISSHLSSVHASTTSSVPSSLVLLCVTLVCRCLASGLSLSHYRDYLDAHISKAEDNTTTTMTTSSNDDDTHSLPRLPGSFSQTIKTIPTPTRFLSLPSTGVDVSPLPTNTIESQVLSGEFADPTGTNLRYTQTLLPSVPMIRIHHVEIEDSQWRGALEYGSGSGHQQEDRTESNHGTKSNETTEHTGRKQSASGSSLFTATTGSGSGSPSSDSDDDDDKNRNRGHRHNSHYNTASASSSSSSCQISDSEPESDTNSDTISDSDTRRGSLGQRQRLRPHPAFGTGPTAPLVFDLTTDPGYIIQDPADDADVDTDTEGSEFRNGDGDGDLEDGRGHDRRQGQGRQREERFIHRWQDHRGRRMAWDWTAMPQN